MTEPEPPREQFPDLDIDTIRHIRLKQILILLTVAVILSAIPYILIGEWYVTGWLVAMLSALGACSWLDARGRTERASLLLLLSMFVMAAALAWRSDGLHDSSILIFPTILVIAALLIGRSAYFWLFALIVGYVALLTLATNFWGWREDENSSGELFYARDILVILTVLGLAVRLISNDLQKLLRVLKRRIAQLETTKRELAHLSQHDGLTGLTNRVMGAGRITQAINQAERHGSKVAILFIDLDNFKSINDRYGHAIGDRVLEIFAEVASSCLRRIDLFGRLGGEEFAALLHDTTRERALAVAEQIRSSFAAATRVVEGRPVDGTVSIGVVIAYDAVLDLSALLAQADHALYRAKDAGRNRIEIASIELILDRARRGAAEVQRAVPVRAGAKSAA